MDWYSPTPKLSPTPTPSPSPSPSPLTSHLSPLTSHLSPLTLTPRLLLPLQVLFPHGLGRTRIVKIDTCAPRTSWTLPMNRAHCTLRSPHLLQVVVTNHHHYTYRAQRIRKISPPNAHAKAHTSTHIPPHPFSCTHASARDCTLDSTRDSTLMGYVMVVNDG